MIGWSKRAFHPIGCIFQVLLMAGMVIYVSHHID